jgi:arsenate reductase
MNPIKRVLFICTGNSARSQMAEGLLRQLAGKRYEVFSAGTDPKGLHVRSVDVMGEIGVDLTGHTSKSLDLFLEQKFDHVITVCDRAREHCPVFPASRTLHWDFDDPATAPEESQPEEFRRVRDEILERIRSFLTTDGE